MFDLNRYTTDEKVLKAKTNKGMEEQLKDPNISDAARYRDQACDWAVYILLILVTIWF